MMRTSKPPLMLPNGLAAYGATPTAVRLYQLIRDYFDSGIAIEPGMTVFDVGANVGLFSLEVLQRSDGDVALFSFEPAPAIFADLERNLAELFPDARARAFRCALADRPGQETFYYRPLAPVLSSLQRDGPIDEGALAASMLRGNPPEAYRDIHGPWMRRLPPWLSSEVLELLLRLGQRRIVPVPCEVKTVSQVLCEEEIEVLDLLKIDVEGAELDVLRGIEAQDWPRIRAVVAEVHDVDDRVQAVRSLLEQGGFGRVDVRREWLFESTNIHMVSAHRS